MPDEPVTVVSTELVGKKGSQRTRHHLSNGWWVDEGGRSSQRKGHRFVMYKPTSGTGGTFVAGANKLKRLLDQIT